MSDAEAIVCDTLREVAKEHGLDETRLSVTPISTGGGNYTSHLFLGKFEGDDVQVFAKVAAIGDKFRSKTPMKIYEVERFFYTKLAKIYRELEDAGGVPEGLRLRSPRFWGCNAQLYQETVVLEDLAARGYGQHERTRPVTWQYAAAAVTQLATLHALSLAYQTRHPQQYQEDADMLKLDWKKNNEDMLTYWDAVLATALAAVDDENREKVKRFFETKFDREKFDGYGTAKGRAMLVHGDYRPSNLMHKELEDGSVEIVPVDFQTLQPGSPAVDLLYFVVTGTDEAFRRAHYRRLLDHYYAALAAALGRLGLDADKEYPRKEFDEEIEDKLPFGLVLAIFLLPVVTVEAQHAPTVSEELDMADFAVKTTSALFPQRLNGVVRDYVRWGVLT